jgi:hydrogenase/urease accessory protein HupE
MIKRYAAATLWCWLAAPAAAFAHTPIEGASSFQNGLLHPVFVPAHWLLLIATGLFLGQQGRKQNLPAVAVFLVSTIVGLVAAWFSVGGELEIVLIAGAAIVGLLIAASPVIGPYWCSLIAALTGFFVAMDSAQETLAGREKWLALFGSGVAIDLLLLYPLVLADYFRNKAWQRIGIRVVGSWVAASALLVLALSFSRSRY